MERKFFGQVELLYNRTLIAFNFYTSQNFPQQAARFKSILSIFDILKTQRNLFTTSLTTPIVKFVIDNF
jgi:hypothetical protein